MGVDVSKQIGYAVLIGQQADVSKQVAYVALKLPSEVSVSKQVAYVALAPPEQHRVFQSGIQVVANTEANLRALQSGLNIVLHKPASFQVVQSGVQSVGYRRLRPFNWVLPEEPIEEVWRWRTDIITSDNGTEQRIALRTTPRVELTHSFALDNAPEMRQVFRAMWSELGTPVPMPHYQYPTKLQQAALTGHTRIYFDPKKTNLRAGSYAFIKEGDEFQIVRVKNITVDGARLLDTIGPDFSTRAVIMPLTYNFVASGAGMKRIAADTWAEMQLTGLDSATISPLTNPEVEAVTLPTCDGYAILDRRPVGSSFEQNVITGAELVDPGVGVASFADPWKRGDLSGNRTIRLSRLHGQGTSPDIEWFRTFADYCKGSCVPFIAPSWRDDFDVVSAVPGGSTITIAGHDYGEYYMRHTGWRFIALETAAGLVVRRVDDVDVSGSNSVLTLQEALPGDLGAVTKMMLAPLSRIGDDSMSLVHFAWRTEVTFPIRTTDE